MTQFIKEPLTELSFLPDFTILSADEAYIRSEDQDGNKIWAIYDSNGEKIGHAGSREIAIALAFQNDLLPFSVH